MFGSYQSFLCWLCCGAVDDESGEPRECPSGKLDGDCRIGPVEEMIDISEREKEERGEGRRSGNLVHFFQLC